MKIMIDADSCRVLAVTEQIAKKYDIPCHIYYNTSTTIESDYSTIHIVDDGKDAVDFAIINVCEKNDIVITNDSGLAAMVLSKNAIAVNASGAQYTNANILSYLNRRYVRQTISRKTKRKQVKGDLYNKDMRPISYKRTLSSLIEKVKEKGLYSV